jgi:hypothetical protein
MRIPWGNACIDARSHATDMELRHRNPCRFRRHSEEWPTAQACSRLGSIRVSAARTLRHASRNATLFDSRDLSKNRLPANRAAPRDRTAKSRTSYRLPSACQRFGTLGSGKFERAIFRSERRVLRGPKCAAHADLGPIRSVFSAYLARAAMESPLPSGEQTGCSHASQCSFRGCWSVRMSPDSLRALRGATCLG